MKRRLCIIFLVVASFFSSCYATIGSVEQALRVSDFLDSLHHNYKDAFRHPNVRYALEELVAFFQECNDFTAHERASLFKKLRRYIELVEEIDAQHGPATKYLNPDQTLVTYWTQVVDQMMTILDSQSNGSGYAATITYPELGYLQTYTLMMPQSQGQPYQVLMTDGGSPAQLSWINTVTSDISILYTATSCDNPSTLVLRDASGNIAVSTLSATNQTLLQYQGSGSCPGGVAVLSVSGGSASTVTIGNAATTTVSPAADGTTNLGTPTELWSGVYTYTIDYYNNGQTVAVSASPQGSQSYALYWPTTASPAVGYVLESLTSGSQTQLQWASVGTLVSGTYCDYPNRVVLRDGNGNFAATTITLTSQTLLTYNAVGNACPGGTPILAIPGTSNLFVGLNVGDATVSGAYNIGVGSTTLDTIGSGSGNTAFGYGALSAVTSGSYNTAVGYNAGSSSNGTNNIYIGAYVTGNAGDSGVINIGVPTAGSSGTYINGIYSQNLPGVVPLVGVTSANLLGVAQAASITTLTVTQSLYVDSLNGSVVATNGLLTATIGVDGTRLASFPSTNNQPLPVDFFQPVEPSRESYFFDDFISFNNTSGDMFYGDTPWVIGNNTAARVSPQKPTVTNGALSLGVTRLTTAGTSGTNNYLTKQLNTGGFSYGLTFTNVTQYCMNEWRVALPQTSTVSTFTAFVGFGDNPTATPKNGIYFAYDPNLGYWTINTASGGSSQTQSVASAYNPTAGTFQRLGFQVTAGATSVNFFINGVLVGTNTLYIPLLGNSSYCGPLASIVKTATGTTPVSLDVDYWYMHYTFNTRR